ncbi:MAG: hypothetical protein IKO00_04910, partial [Oscillospiraceae bacterium]|nr:hypothetical protein [Oscillospiraceae bacterium]
MTESFLMMSLSITGTFRHTAVFPVITALCGRGPSGKCEADRPQSGGYKIAIALGTAKCYTLFAANAPECADDSHERTKGFQHREDHNMKVSELPYRRVTIEEVTAVMEDVLARIK